MKLLGKIFGYTLLSLIGLIVVLLVGIQLISDEQYKTWISKAASSATGRQLTINGGFDLHLGTSVSLLAEDVHFSNAQWSAQKDMVSADKLFVKIALFPLIQGILDCNAKLTGATVLLETDKQGIGNWVFDDGAEKVKQNQETAVESSSEPFSLPIKPLIRNFAITNFNLSYVDGKSGQQLHTLVELLSLSIDGDAMPFTLKATYQDAPVELAGTLGNVSDYHENRQTKINLQGMINTAPLAIQGVLGPLTPALEMDLDLALTANSIANFAPFSPAALPQLGGLDIKLTTFAKGGSFGAKDIFIGLDDPNLHLTAQGSIANLMEVSGIDLTAEASSQQLQDIAEKFGLEVPGELPDSMSITAATQGDLKKLTLNKLEAQVKDEGATVALTGSIEDIITLKGVQATINGELESLASLNPLTGSELPPTGPWKLKLDADTEMLLKSPVQLVASLEGEGTQTTIHADIADITLPQNFNAELNIEAPSIASLNDLLGQDLPSQWPLKFTAKATGEPTTYALSDLFIGLGEGAVTGNLTYALPDQSQNKPTAIQGGLHIKDLDITPLLSYEGKEGDQPEEIPAEEVAEAEQEDTQKPAKLFSSTPLKEGPLRDYVIDIDLSAENFTIAKDFAIESEVGITLDQGLLNIAPIKLASNVGGQGDGNLTIDGQGETATIDIALNYDNLVPPGLNGLLNIDVDLDGAGASMAELMASLGGHFITSVADVEIPNSFATHFGGGIIHQVNPFVGDKTTLECAIIRFDAEDGLVDFNRKIAMQTSEVTWIGAGQIDLHTEEIDVGVKSKPRKKVSALTHAGLAGIVHVGGTLTKPKLGIDKKDVAKKYVSYSALVATGGLSFIIQKIFATHDANKNHCERIIEEGAKNE